MRAWGSSWHIWLLPLSLLTVVGSSARAETLIAVAVPTDSLRQELATSIRRGAEEAVANLGPLPRAIDPPLRIEMFASGCTAREGTAAAETILAAQPAIVVGHPCAAAAVAAAPVYAKAGVTLFAVGVRHPALTTPASGHHIFRLAGRDDRQGTEAGAYLARAFPSQPVAIVHDRTATARALAEAAAAEHTRLTGRPATLSALVTGGKDYTRLVNEIIAAGAGSVFFTGYPAEGNVLLTGLRASGWTGTFLGHDALATPEFAAYAADGHNGTLSLAATETLSKAQATRAAIEAWVTAVTAADTTEPAAIAAVLARGVHTRSAGTVAFDERGDLVGPSYKIRVFRNGVWGVP